MIATWMLYSVAVSAVCGVCALALEHGVRRVGMPVRWLWAGALLASLVLCALPWARSGEGRRMGSAAVVLGEETIVEYPLPVPVEPTAARLEVSPPPALLSRLGSADRPLLALWAVATGLGMLYLLGTHRTLARRRRLWKRTMVDGVPALLSRDVGPAVVGFLDSAIVVPAWVTELDAEQRRLVLAHEEEHLLAGDARLLSLALVAVAAAPWNPALWWQVRRLRHAVELDCDARVLDGDADAERYCDLLIEVGARASMRGVAFAAFAESSSFLERRIMSVVGPRPRRWTIAAGIVVTLAGALLVSAFSAPIPTFPGAQAESPEYMVLADEVYPEEAVTVDSSVKIVPEMVYSGLDTTVLMTEMVVEEATPVVLPDQAFPEVVDIAELVRRRHPDLYADGLPLEQAIWFVVGRDGKIAKSWVGPNLYLNFQGGYQPLNPQADRSAELARAQARAQELVLAQVPGLRVRGMYAAHVYADPGVFSVHFFTESAGQPARDGGLDHTPTIVGRAVAAELGR